MIRAVAAMRSRFDDSEYRSYRSDEELDVYEQSCGNCLYSRIGGCPIDIAEEKEARMMEREDAIHSGRRREWCIYWEQDRRRNGW